MTIRPNARITGAFTRDSQGRVVVEARGPMFVERALHPMAKVGNAPVVGLLASDGVLRGVVLGSPNRGDELVVRYVPEPEIRTGIRFNVDPLPVA